MARQFDVDTRPDGSVVISAHGTLGPEQAVHLRQTLVYAVRHTRPLRLILDLGDVAGIDPINLGTFAAACGLGDDHRVAVFLDNPTAPVADLLAAAGVPAQRLRHTAVPTPLAG